MSGSTVFNPFPNNRFLDWTKFKAFADNKIREAKMMIYDSDRVENIVGIGENAVTSIFSFSHNVFKELLSRGSLKVGIMW